jgi:hypothetical protein
MIVLVKAETLIKQRRENENSSKPKENPTVWKKRLN